MITVGDRVAIRARATGEPANVRVTLLDPASVVVADEESAALLDTGFWLFTSANPVTVEGVHTFQITGYAANGDRLGSIVGTIFVREDLL